MSSAPDIYAELPISLRKKLRPTATQTAPVGTKSKQPPSTAAGPSRDLTGLVPVVARNSIASKLEQRALPLSNPPKESDRTLKEREVRKNVRWEQKIANKRRRSGRLVKMDLGPLPAGGFATNRPLLNGRVSYQLLLPLHALWLGYISELLNLELRKAIPPPQAMTTVPQEASTSAATQADSSSNNIAAMVGAAPDQGSSNYTLQQMQMWQGKLVKADFHGCEIEVTRAKNPSLVGLAGIVAQETEGMFRIVTSRDVVKAIPKKNVTFAFSLPLPADQEGKLRDLRFELHGSNIVFKSADRASRKFKAKGAKGLDF